MGISRFPNKLKSYRRCNGYSQKKVARMLGLADTSTLSRWEHGIALPNITHVFRLAKLYRVKPYDLYDELSQQVEHELSLLVQKEEPFNSNHSFYV